MTNSVAHPDPEELMAWNDNEVDAGTAARIRSHVDGCASCRAGVDEVRRVGTLANAWRVEPAPAAIRAHVMANAQPPAARPVGFWRHYRWHLAAAASVLVLGFFAAEATLCGSAFCLRPGAESSGRSTVPQDADFDTAWQARPRVDLGIPSDGAAVLVVWFVDYECPGCAQVDAAYMSVLEHYAAAYPGVVKVVIRDWPWNAECNPNTPITFQGHEASCAAVVATRIAADRGVLPAMKHWLFTHQPATIQEVRDATASITGSREFDDRYPAEIAALQRELSALANAGVSGTPSCYVNGVRAVRDDHGGLLSPADLSKAIEYELRHRPRKI